MPTVANATCGVSVIRDGRLIFCGEPAAFDYQGLVTPRSGETYQLALKRRGKVHEMRCMEHTRETFTRMEPALRDGSASLRCIIHERLTIYCRSCQSLFRFEPLPPTTVKMPGKFCPNCARPTVVRLDPTLDYWEIISEALGLGASSALFTARLHSEWIKDRTATAAFVEYISSIMEELNV